MATSRSQRVEKLAVPSTDDRSTSSAIEQPSRQVTPASASPEHKLILGGSISRTNFLGTGNKGPASADREYQGPSGFAILDRRRRVICLLSVRLNELDVDVAITR